MMSRFDEIFERRGSGSAKYDAIPLQGLPEDTLPLWVADMDFQAPDCVAQALRAMTEHGIYGYNMPTQAYQQAVIGWFTRRFGWTPKAEWMVETPGIVYALHTAVCAFTAPGDTVMVLTPVYPHFYFAAEQTGRRLEKVALQNVNGHYEIDFAALEAAMDATQPKMLIFCSPHNPVGRVWTRAELERVAELCLARNILIAADEIHCDFVYEGYRHTPFLSLSPALERIAIACTAPSKSFNLAGLECSSIWIPNPELRSAFQNVMQAQGLNGVNTAGRVACQAAYEGGDAWMDELLQYLRGNYEALCAYLAEQLPMLSVGALEGTYLAWVDARALGMPQEALDELLRHKAHVWFSSGAEYGAEGFWRVNLACPRSVLLQALERLKAALDA